jgi:hypothetical protein
MDFLTLHNKLSLSSNVYSSYSSCSSRAQSLADSLPGFSSNSATILFPSPHIGCLARFCVDLDYIVVVVLLLLVGFES